MSQIPLHQLIGHYGIGSIYELRSHWNERQSGLHSVMVAGLDFWDSEHLDLIHDPVLEQILNVSALYSPPLAPERDGRQNAAVPVVRFPKWLVCDHCQRLGRVPEQFNDENFSGPRCLACHRGRGMPARLVVACQPRSDGDQGQAGHIDDFPWEYWAHHGRPCDKPQLQIRVLPGTSSLRGLVVACLNPACVEQQVERSLGDALRPEALSHWHCSGKRPWLDDDDRGCSRPVRALFRHASNVYFPDIVSAVSIPPFSTELYQLLQRRDGRIIRRIRRDRERNRTIDWDRIVEELRDEERWIQPFEDTQIIVALKALSDINDISVDDYRMKEREALLAGYPESPRALFVAVPLPDETIPASLERVVSHIVQVQRLREVRVLRGFRRISPSDKSAPLARTRGDTNWLPAVEMHGEGIYLEWNRHAIEGWARQEAIEERLGVVTTAVEQHLRDRANPVAMLIHTLSHLLIKQLALDSGHGLGALRERLYLRNQADDWAAGVLIYTASTASGGTLGGLVRQGTPARISRLLASAYDEARWCSSDPLCIEHRELVDREPNLAACHACCLISETACEWSNQFLDRALVVGDLKNPNMGFLTGRFDSETR
jgi:hypothetical protein